MLKSEVENGKDPISAIMEIETKRYTKDILEMLDGKQTVRAEAVKQINFKDLESDFLKKIVYDYLAYL